MKEQSVQFESVGPWKRPKPAHGYVPPSSSPKPVEPLWSGSKAKRVKASIGYEDDSPRCQNCKQFMPTHLEMENSIPRWTPDRCREHRIRVKQTGCCDKWKGKNGDTLAA